MSLICEYRGKSVDRTLLQRRPLHAIGHPINLASWIQAVAATGSIAVSMATSKLVEGFAFAILVKRR